eukprot:4985665-Pyramimonas_sp.AAC.1
MHTPEDVVTCLNREVPGANLTTYSDLSNVQIQALISHLGEEVCLTHLEASVSARALMESLGDGLAGIGQPHGDNARLPPENMDAVE